MSLIKQHFEEAFYLLEKFLSDEKNFEKIEQAGNLMTTALKGGHKIISCGNGGSMCDAMHFAEELSGRYKNHRKSLAAIAISDPSHLTCVANDYGFENVFSRYIEGLGNAGDVLLAISTSGNSKNIVNAINVAKEKNLFVVGLTGKSGGEMASLCDVEIRAPFAAYSDRVQEIHIKVIHSLIDFIEHSI